MNEITRMVQHHDHHHDATQQIDGIYSRAAAVDLSGLNVREWLWDDFPSYALGIMAGGHYKPRS